MRNLFGGKSSLNAGVELGKKNYVATQTNVD
jgi:hypothetical protein